RRRRDKSVFRILEHHIGPECLHSLNSDIVLIRIALALNQDKWRTCPVRTVRPDSDIHSSIPRPRPEQDLITLAVKELGRQPFEVPPLNPRQVLTILNEIVYKTLVQIIVWIVRDVLRFEYPPERHRPLKAQRVSVHPR